MGLPAGLAKPVPAEARSAALLLVAAWFGLLSGLLEVLYRLAEKGLGFRWYLQLSPDFVWMAPLTDVALFLVPGVLFVALSRLGGRRHLLPVVVFVYSALLCTKLLLLIGHLHEWAILLLGIGLASRISHLLAKHLLPFLVLVRRSTGWMVVLVSALAVTTVGANRFRERRALAAVPAARPGAPNVLLITLDTVRAENLSLYGYSRRTSPQLERWAAQGVCFRRALAPAPWTLPSHASMFTGRHPHQLSAGWATPLDGSFPTLAEVLSRHGYLTGGFVANRYYASRASGLSRGFAHYEDYALCPGEFIRSSALSRWSFSKDASRRLLDFYDIYGRKNAEQLNRDFLGWLAGQDGRPFFAFLNYYDAHEPYMPPPPFAGLFSPPRTTEELLLLTGWFRVVKQELSPEQIQMALRAYDEALAYLDHQAGLLLTELERRGILDNTLVIITADHGEHFDEHDLFMHGNSLYRSLLHVPLVIRFPKRVPAGKQVAAFVGLRDLPATVLDLLDITGATPFPGSSLACYWEMSEGKSWAEASPVLCEASTIPEGYIKPDHGCSPVAGGPMVSLFQDGKYYIQHLEDGGEEIYDFESDPGEQQNLARGAEGEALLKRYRQALNRVLQED